MTSVAVCLHRIPQGGRGFRYGAFHGNRETMPPPLRLPFQKRYFLLVPCVLVCYLPAVLCCISRISRLWSACMVCILSCRASMVSSWSATSLCRAVFSLSSVLTLLLPKENRRSRRCWRLRWLPPFQLLGLYLFFARLSSSRAVSFCCCKSTTSALKLSASFCISR